MRVAGAVNYSEHGSSTSSIDANVRRLLSPLRRPVRNLYKDSMSNAVVCFGILLQ